MQTQGPTGRRQAKSAVSLLAACVLAAPLLCGDRASASRSASEEALDKFSQAWQQVTSYTCLMDVHERSGDLVQQRVMHVAFQKPHATRVDVISGDSHGSSIVWMGGDDVRAHEGGLLSAIKASLNLKDHRVTTIRGETMADANWGAVYEHLVSLPAATVEASHSEDTMTVSITVTDPKLDNGVTKEVIVLSADGLPLEYDQYQDDVTVKHATNSDIKLNVDLPESTWTL